MELIYRIKKPETIKRFMTENNIPTSILQKDEKNYKIFVNNEIKSRKDTIRKGDKIHFLLDEEGLNKFKPQDLEIEVVYEDEYLLIVNKPADMLLMPSKANPENTLGNFLVGYYQKNNISSMIHYVNRIDREAQGLVVIAKHRFVKFLLSNKIDNELVFNYKTIVSGKMDTKEFEICLPIAKKEGTYLREVVEVGEDCSTKYRVEKEFKNFSLLDISVKGKLPHQIRVHLAYFNYPIVGDKLYNKEDYPTKLLLLCYKTNFIHPITEKEINITLDLTQDFTDFIKK